MAGQTDCRVIGNVRDDIVLCRGQGQPAQLVRVWPWRDKSSVGEPGLRVLPHFAFSQSKCTLVVPTGSDGELHSLLE